MFGIRLYPVCPTGHQNAATEAIGNASAAVPMAAAVVANDPIEAFVPFHTGPSWRRKAVTAKWTRAGTWREPVGQVDGRTSAVGTSAGSRCPAAVRRGAGNTGSHSKGRL